MKKVSFTFCFLVFFVGSFSREVQSSDLSVCIPIRDLEYSPFLESPPSHSSKIVSIKNLRRILLNLVGDLKYRVTSGLKRPSHKSYKIAFKDEGEREEADDDEDDSMEEKRDFLCESSSWAQQKKWLMNILRGEFEDSFEEKIEVDQQKKITSKKEDSKVQTDEASHAVALETVAENEKSLWEGSSQYELWGEASQVLLLSFANLLYYHKSQKTQEDSDRIEAALSFLKTGKALKEALKDIRSLSKAMPSINRGIAESMGLLGALYEKKQIIKGEKNLAMLEDRLVQLNRAVDKYPFIRKKDHWISLLMEATEDKIRQEKISIKKSYRYYGLSTINLMRTSVSMTVATTSSLGASLVTLGALTPVLSLSVLSSFLVADIKKRPKHYRSQIRRIYFEKKQNELSKKAEKLFYDLSHTGYSEKMKLVSKNPLQVVRKKIEYRRTQKKGYRPLPESEEESSSLEEKTLFKLLGVLETLENIEQEMRKDLWEKEEETHRRRSSSSFELYLQQKKDLKEDLDRYFITSKSKEDIGDENSLMEDLFAMFHLQKDSCDCKEALDAFLG